MIESEATAMVLATVTAALVVGFLGGLLSFKAKQRWCPRCGVTLTCPEGCFGPVGLGRKP
jgi:NADH pyrophosphatase NudC (nudix superfamily)